VVPLSFCCKRNFLPIVSLETSLPGGGHGTCGGGEAGAGGLKLCSTSPFPDSRQQKKAVGVRGGDGEVDLG